MPSNADDFKLRMQGVASTSDISRNAMQSQASAGADSPLSTLWAAPERAHFLLASARSNQYASGDADHRFVGYAGPQRLIKIRYLENVSSPVRIAVRAQNARMNQLKMYAAILSPVVQEHQCR